MHSKDIRRLISYVPQETFLFSNSVKENVAFALNEYDFEKVKEMIRLSAIEDDVEKFRKNMIQ